MDPVGSRSERSIQICQVAHSDEIDGSRSDVATCWNLRGPSRTFRKRSFRNSREFLLLIHDQVESIESALPRAATRVAPGETN